MGHLTGTGMGMGENKTAIEMDYIHTYIHTYIYVCVYIYIRTFIEIIIWYGYIFVYICIHGDNVAISNNYTLILPRYAM
jgi:hypothetical protein